LLGFQLLELAREGNSPRIPDRPPCGLAQIGAGLHPGEPASMDGTTFGPDQNVIKTGQTEDLP
jgi:hypothetical protein